MRATLLFEDLCGRRGRGDNDRIVRHVSMQEEVDLAHTSAGKSNHNHDDIQPLILDYTIDMEKLIANMSIIIVTSRFFACR